MFTTTPSTELRGRKEEGEEAIWDPGIHRGRALQQAQPFRARGQGQDLEWLLEEVKKRIARKE